MADFSIITQSEASKIIVQSQGAFVAWIGAGVSAEAGVPLAQQIADQQSRLDWERSKSAGQSATPDQLDYGSFCESKYGWSRRNRRYSSVMLNAIPNPSARVKYFRDILKKKQPSFAHYALTILMQNRLLHSTCVTTNFDKLIEKSFVVLGEEECQPLRMADEARLVEPDEKGLFYCLKLHGDYDTNNILNTAAEIRSFPEWANTRLRALAQTRGLLVLGAGGHEASVRNAMNNLASGARNDRTLEQGLLWGVYIGGQIEKLDEAERQLLESSPADYEVKLAERAIASGEVSSEIVELMEDLRDAKSKFSFFPIRGSGEFLLRLISDPEVPEAVRDMAAPYLDAEMRTKSLFETHRLPLPALDRRLKTLRSQRQRLEEAKPRLTGGGEWIGKVMTFPNGLTTTLCYGYLSDSELLKAGMPGKTKAAVLSPDDTFISIGGGAALAIATASGQIQSIIHDISKFVPVVAGDVVVTSAGNLPVQYIFHGASLVVQSDGQFKGTEATVMSTMTNALLRCYVLGIKSLFVPLLASGIGGIGFENSAKSMLSAIKTFNIAEADIRVVFVVFQEKDLLRTSYLQFAREAGGQELPST